VPKRPRSNRGQTTKQTRARTLNAPPMQIYVDTDDDVRLARRIQRDVQQRGRDVAGVIEQYTKVGGKGELGVVSL